MARVTTMAGTWHGSRCERRRRRRVPRRRAEQGKERVEGLTDGPRRDFYFLFPFFFRAVTEMFTRCGQIIPDPTYVMLKSKKNLIAATAHERQSSERSPFL